MTMTRKEQLLIEELAMEMSKLRKEAAALSKLSELSAALTESTAALMDSARTNTAVLCLLAQKLDMDPDELFDKAKAHAATAAMLHRGEPK